MTVELTLEERAMLARKCYEVIFEATETFQFDVGIHLSYLLGAILNAKGASAVRMDFAMESAAEFLHALREKFDYKQPLWQFVVLLDEDGNEIPFAAQQCLLRDEHKVSHLSGCCAVCGHEEGLDWADALDAFISITFPNKATG